LLEVVEVEQEFQDVMQELQVQVVEEEDLLQVFLLVQVELTLAVVAVVVTVIVMTQELVVQEELS
tara:strand:+ start:295 stop:489 length:195 start_codon:yes stop_codon:yes gene_type:complete